VLKRLNDLEAEQLTTWMTERWRRPILVKVLTFATVAPLIVVIVHLTHEAAPLWMTLGPALVVTVVVWAALSRRLARESTDSASDMLAAQLATRRWVRWLHRLEPAIWLGVAPWLGPYISHRWQHTYPVAAWWMRDSTAALTVAVALSPVYIAIGLLAAWLVRTTQRSIEHENDIADAGSYSLRAAWSAYVRSTRDSSTEWASSEPAQRTVRDRRLFRRRLS
jgi:hypothetical protein